jgi:hypothetical protein
MQWFGVQWQNVSWSSCHEDQTSSSLSHSILASLEDTKSALIAHLDQSSQAQLEHHGFLETGKIPNILQNKVFGPVKVTILKNIWKIRIKILNQQD